jgi:hypothetical protein
MKLMLPKMMVDVDNLFIVKLMNALRVLRKLGTLYRI